MPPIDDQVNVGITATANTGPGTQKAAADVENAGAKIRASLDGTASATQASMAKMLESIKANVTASSGHFNALTLRLRETGEAFSKFGEVLLAAFAVEKLASAIEGVGKLGESFELAAQRTGMTVGELSTLRTAALNVNVDFGTLVASMGRFNKNLSDAGQGAGTAAGAYRAMGIDVHNADGSLKSLSQIIPEIADKFHGMEDGVNKSALATAIGGRAFAQMIPILNQGSEGLARAEEQARRTGTYMSEGFVAAATHMDESGKELGQSFTGVGLALTKEFVPAIDLMIQGMASIVESFIEGISKGGALYPIIMALATAFDALVVVCSFVKAGIEQVWNVMMLFANTLVILAQTITNVGVALAHLDFDGAKRAAADGLKAMEEEANKRFAKIKQDGQDAVDTLKTVWSHLDDGVDGMKGEDKGPKAPAPDLPKNIPLVEQYKEQLNQMKDADNSWLDFSKQEELKFWADKLGSVRKGTADYVAIYHEYITAKKAAEKDSFDKEITDLKLSMAAAEKDGQERVRLAKEISDKTAAAYGAGSVQAKQALIAVQNEQNKLYQEQRSAAEAQIEAAKAHSDRDIAIEEDAIKTKRTLGDLTAIQEVTSLKELEAKKFEIERKSLEDRLALAHTEPAERQKIQKQIEALENKHAVDTAKLNNQMVVQTAATYEKYMQPVTRAISGTVQGMIQGTTTLKQGLANLMTSILASTVDMLTQSLVKWGATELAKSAATAAGESTRLATHETAQATGMASSAAAGLKSVMNDAYKAAAGAYASCADIPFVGWILAPAAGAAAFAAVAAFGGSIASAAGGWEVPQDSFAMVHKDEKILPARVSRGLDNVLATQERMGNGGGSGGDTHLHMHIQATDAKSFSDQLSNQDSVLYQKSRKFARNAFANRSINPPIR